MQSVHGVTPNLASRIAGVGTVTIVTEVDGVQTVVYIDDVFYVPGAEVARDQGFDFELDHATMNFSVSMEGRTLIVAIPQEETWIFQVTHPSLGGSLDLGPQGRALCNYTVAEGVATLSLWHERLCYTCPQYIKTMVDKGSVRGMMLTRRKQDTCDACHLGKQKKKTHRKKINRATKKPNQVVYADLLIPSNGNGTRYEAVLVIMDGYSRFVTVYLLTSKSSPVVNESLLGNPLREHIKVTVFMDGLKVDPSHTQIVRGREFINRGMENWYRARSRRTKKFSVNARINR
ncbi:Copia protein [Phytophthora palmivora]|uniref:Copia protein n=1 Tax=Phytophthora palmivora TaxID=4796 RepID=A0A2P4YRH4_9STRA|nr:Copia protein [Phytophthora palmivora]